MANTSSAVNTVCPYYCRDHGKSITCEGLISGTLCTMRFASEQARRDWQATNCEMINYYNCCPLAAALEEKYGG